MSRKRVTSRLRRPRPVLEALFALCTFVCGFELFPSLHQAAHAMLAPHVHEGGTGFVSLAHEHTDRHEREPGVERARDHDHHGADSIAHRGLAFLHAPDATPTVPFAGVIARIRCASVQTHETHAPVQTATARGPPCGAAAFISRSAA